VFVLFQVYYYYEYTHHPHVSTHINIHTLGFGVPPRAALVVDAVEVHFQCQRGVCVRVVSCSSVARGGCRDDADGCVRACVGVGRVDGDARENEGDEREDERDGVVVGCRVVVTAVVVVGDRARVSFIASPAHSSVCRVLKRTPMARSSCSPPSSSRDIVRELERRREAREREMRSRRDDGVDGMDDDDDDDEMHRFVDALETMETMETTASSSSSSTSSSYASTREDAFECAARASRSARVGLGWGEPVSEARRREREARRALARALVRGDAEEAEEAENRTPPARETARRRMPPLGGDGAVRTSETSSGAEESEDAAKARRRRRRRAREREHVARLRRGEMR